MRRWTAALCCLLLFCATLCCLLGTSAPFRGVFLKVTQDEVADTCGMHLALCPLPGNKVRMVHFNGWRGSRTKYIGTVIEPVVLEFNWRKYHDPLVNLILLRGRARFSRPQHSASRVDTREHLCASRLRSVRKSGASNTQKRRLPRSSARRRLARKS